MVVFSRIYFHPALVFILSFKYDYFIYGLPFRVYMLFLYIYLFCNIVNISIFHNYNGNSYSAETASQFIFI